MPAPTVQRFLDKGGHLNQWPTKRADKLLALAYLASKFELDKHYTEKQVNELLKTWHTFGDWALLRRELFEQNFLDRNRDGSRYWRQALPTPLDGLTLVKPDIERDAHASVKWLAGEEGKQTLRLMGNDESHIKATSLEEERKRVRDFITSSSQLTWMIRYQSEIVGAVWVDLEPTPYLGSPAVHIMIGEPLARSKGIGENTIRAVISQLRIGDRYNRLHSRHLVDNPDAAKLLIKVGFQNDGRTYSDEDGLIWQNVVLNLAI